MKVMIMLLFAVNIIGFGYNTLSLVSRMEKTEQSQAAQARCEEVQKVKLALENDITTIRQGALIMVPDVPRFLAEKWPGQADTELAIPRKEKSFNLSTTLEEQRWTVDFKAPKKSYPHSAAKIGAYCEAIEKGAGFQVKEINLGSRIPTWGKDKWQANGITIRKVRRKQK